MRLFLASATPWGLVIGLGLAASASPPIRKTTPAPSPVAAGSLSEPSGAPDDQSDLSVPRPERPIVGTVDLRRVFAESRQFQKLSATLRVAVEKAEAELKTRREKFAAMSNELAATEVGTAAHKTLNETLSLESARMAASIASQKAEFVRTEANNNREAFYDIRSAVAALADARDLRLVLSESREDVSDDPQTIVKAINGLVQYQDEIDLTDAVIARLNGPPADDDQAAAIEMKGAPCELALIDLGRIFAEDDEFKRLTEALKRDVDQAEAKLKEQRDAMAAETEKLAQLDQASDAYRAKDTEIRESTALMQSSVALQKQEFMNREARNYFTVFQSVHDETRRLAESRHIRLVLRFDGDGKPLAKPEDVIKAINNFVIYHRGIDITDEVIAARKAHSSE